MLAAPDAPSGDQRGLDPDENLPLPAGPGFDARPLQGSSLPLVLHVVGATLNQDGPAGALCRVDLVDFERDLVVRVGDPGAQVLAERTARLGAEDYRPVKHLEVHRKHDGTEPAGKPDTPDLRRCDEPQRLVCCQLFQNRLHTGGYTT